MAGEEKQPSYPRRVLQFYLAPNWLSFFSIFYFLFFGYFALFYSGHLVVALRFLLYTLRHSAELLGLNYLFSGALFFLALVVPFSASIYAVVLGYEINLRPWSRRRKWSATLLLIILVPLVVALTDVFMRTIATTSSLSDFAAKEALLIGARTPREPTL